jgi:putative nucleotidyltransferase with HDIG domain
VTPSAPQTEALRLRVEERLAALPPLPTSVRALLVGDPRSDAFHASVLELVQRQASLSSRILAIANSMEDDETGQPVLGLPQAVARVGTWRIARLIVLNVLLRVFPPDSESRRRLWQHALTSATAAREIARASSRATHSHEAYIAGLLHDVGRFLLAGEEATDLARPEEEGWRGAAPVLERERQLLGCDHTELGRRICDAWSLPEELVQLVRLHHTEPPLPIELSGRALDTLRILQQGDRLASLLLHRPQFEALPPDERLTLLERSCIHAGWDWTPAGPTHLDLLVGPILARSDERITALGLEGA